MRMLGMLLAAVVLAAGCACVEPSDTTSADESFTTPPLSTTRTGSSTTSSSSLTQPAKEAVVYVAMGDSGAFTPPSPDGLIYRYSEMLADQFATEIDLRNRAVGSLHSTTMLEQLRASEDLRGDLGAADVVTSNIPINVWVESLKTVTSFEGRDPADPPSSTKSSRSAIPTRC